MISFPVHIGFIDWEWGTESLMAGCMQHPTHPSPVAWFLLQSCWLAGDKSFLLHSSTCSNAPALSVREGFKAGAQYTDYDM